MDEVRSGQPRLRRRLSLPLLVLYGLGGTIGAGIYVLIGVTAGAAGVYAPAAFLLAAVIMVFSASGFAEFAGRLPVSAGEAAYVRAGFETPWLGTFVGLLVVLAGSVSAATVSVGSIGYLHFFVDVPTAPLIVLVVFVMGAIAAVGILESVMFASFLTLVEIGGLLVIIFGGFAGDFQLADNLPSVFPLTLDGAVWAGVLGAGLFAFFAFIGFEDLVNVAEEVKQPEKTMPRAIFWTLGLTTLLYFLVVSVAVLTVPSQELAASPAPLGLVFERVTSLPPAALAAIAVVATLNGIIIQMIMASRVLYGLSMQGGLPRLLSYIHPLTRTPLVATGLVVVLVLTLALVFPLDDLAKTTSRVTLTIFALVNVALLKVKLMEEAPPTGLFLVPIWVPLVGFVACAAFLTFGG